MESKLLKKKIYIVTENTDGKLYVLEADHYNELVNDYMGERKYIPADNAKVFFASYCGRPINPYVYTDFLSCARYIQYECCNKWEKELLWSEN